MNIDIDSIVKKIDIEKLIEEDIKSRISECIDIGDIIDTILQDEKLEDFIHKRVVNIVDEYLLSDDGKKCIIEKFKETIDDADILCDDRITDAIAEFLKKSLMKRC